MRDRLADLGELTDVILITFSTPANVVDYAVMNELPFPVLIDPDRRTYHAYGLGRGTLARVYGWRAGWRYLELFRAGRLRALRRPTEDTLQLGGDFIIAPDGTLAWGFWGAGPDDRPEIDDLIAALRRL